MRVLLQDVTEMLVGQVHFWRMQRLEELNVGRWMAGEAMAAHLRVRNNGMCHCGENEGHIKIARMAAESLP